MSHNQQKPFLLHFMERQPTMVPPECVYDAHEQRCIVDHRQCGDSTSTMEYTTGYTPWTGQEDKD